MKFSEKYEVIPSESVLHSPNIIGVQKSTHHAYSCVFGMSLKKVTFVVSYVCQLSVK